MSGDNKKNLKRAMFEALNAQLASDGFILKASKDSFVRRRNGTVDIFQLVCLADQPGWRIQPNVAVRVDRVEEIFHHTSGFELKYQKDTPTIGGAIGNIIKNSNRACEFPLKADADVALVVE